MEVLASFCAEARGIHFYEFSLEEVVAGLRFGSAVSGSHYMPRTLTASGLGAVQLALWGTLAERLLLTWHLCLMQDLMLMGMF